MCVRLSINFPFFLVLLATNRYKLLNILFDKSCPITNTFIEVLIKNLEALFG